MSRRPERDRGMTLVEVMVAMAVGSILLTGVATVFVGMLQGSKTIVVKTSTGADARIAAESMSRTLRVAAVPSTGSAFASGTATSMSFYALLNRTGAQSTTQPTPTLVAYTYDVATNCLNEAMTPGVAITSPVAGGPSFTWAPAQTKTKCLLRTATAPTFTYFTSPLFTASPITVLPLTSANLAAVRSVGVHLVATDPQNQNVSGVQADTRITIENLL